MHVGNLEHYALAGLRADGHDLASSLSQVRDVGAIGGFVLDPLTELSVLHNADAFTE